MKISRKSKDAQKVNRDAVRRIIENAVELKEGIYLFIDRAGNAVVADTNDGKAYRAEYNVSDKSVKIISAFTDGENSKKNNGYLYVQIAIIDNLGQLKTIQYGTHSIMAMLTHKKEYDDLDKEGLTPICNHKDNIKWNNKADNLEWVTQGMNVEHGKIVNGIHRVYNGKYTKVIGNQSDELFIGLKQPLSTELIDEYKRFVGDRKVFKCRHDEVIDEEEIIGLVRFLVRYNHWEVE